MLGTIAGFIFNFSIAIYEKKLDNEKLIADFAEFIKIRLEMDENEENRTLILQAVANTIFKYQ